jgi:hypothetical protein
MNRGYVLVWRKIQDSGLMQMPNTLAIFLHILFSATHKDIKVGTPHGVIELKRGQYISGRKKLAEELEQTEREIRTSLKRLVNLQILTIKTTSKYSIYTIEKYSVYQDINFKTTKKTTNKRPTDDQQTTTKQTHNTQNTHNPFDEFWDLYPKKTGKAPAMKAWDKMNPDIEIIKKALSWQKETEEWKKQNGQFVPMASTYLNQERWLDEKQSNSNNDWMKGMNLS